MSTRAAKGARNAKADNAQEEGRELKGKDYEKALG